MVESAADAYDVILIDRPPFLGTLSSMGWAVSERFSRSLSHLFSVAGTERTLRAIVRFQQESGISIDGAGVVINKMRPTTANTATDATKCVLFGEFVAEPVLAEKPCAAARPGRRIPDSFCPTKNRLIRH